MDFGMPFLLETKTIEDCSELCSSLKLNFIELNMNFPQCQLAVLNAYTLNRIKKNRQLYFTIHLDENLNICDFNSIVRDAYREATLAVIALAKEIQAPIINMHLAKGIYITLPDRKELLFKKYESEYISNILGFRELCEKAIGTSNIKIAIENTDGFMEHEKAAIDMLLESDCFGLTLDIGHNHSAHDKDMGFFQKHSDKLIHMHAHDVRGSKDHLAFGDGEIDLRQCLQLAQNANARVVLETKTVAALKATVSKLKNYLC